jgi:hypothetical protein
MTAIASMTAIAWVTVQPCRAGRISSSCPSKRESRGAPDRLPTKQFYRKNLVDAFFGEIRVRGRAVIRPAFREANGNRSAPRMRSNDCMRSSIAGSRPKPFCHRRKQLQCCSGLSLLQGRSQCAKSMAGKALAKSLPIRSLTSPHDRVTSSCWRSR